MKKFIIVLILVLIFFFLGYKRIENEVKTWEEIETQEIILEENLAEKTIAEIIQEVAVFEKNEYYLEDLNKDGFLEALVISLSNDSSAVDLTLIKIINSEGDFEKIGSLFLEEYFSGLPFVEETKDIKQNNVQEIVVNLNLGGAANQTHAILEYQDGFNFVSLKEESGEKRRAIFLIGASAMHHQFYLLKEREIIEINSWQDFENDFSLMCQANVYILENNVFVFNQKLSEELLKKLGDDCLLEE